MRLPALLSLVVLALGSAGLAGTASAGEYMFSLSWEPSFCRAHADRSECRALTPDAYDGRHLVLHGLWPQGREYCGVPATVKEQDQDPASWGDMPAVTVSDTTRSRMERLFPGVASHLDRHEWYKHGTCSGLSPDGYFTLAMDLVEQANALVFGQVITAHAGRALSVDDLCGALTQDFGSDFLRAASVRKPGAELGEVRFALRDTDQPLALDRDHLSPGRKSMSCSGTLEVTAAGGS